MWVKEIWVGSPPHSDLCTWPLGRRQGEHWRSRERSKGAICTLGCRIQGTQLIRLGCSCSSLQRRDIELKRHSRSAPICLEDNFQPSSAKGHWLYSKALPTTDAKIRPAIQGWTLIQFEWKPRGGQRKQNRYNPSGFSYHPGQGFPKSGLCTTDGMGNNTFR